MQGVQAIFTPKRNRRGNILAVIGLLGIAVGTVLWMRSIQALNGSIGTVIFAQLVSSSVVLASLGVLSILGGVGLCIYSTVIRRTDQEKYEDEDDVYEREASREQSDSHLSLTANVEMSADPSHGRIAPRRISRTLGIAIFQSLILMALYGGLVQEYNSNTSMQGWIRSNFAMGGVLLNYNAMLVVAGVLGVLVLQFLPGRRFSD